MSASDVGDSGIIQMTGLGIGASPSEAPIVAEGPVASASPPQTPQPLPPLPDYQGTVVDTIA